MRSSMVAGVLAATLLAAPAGATVLTATLPEFSGPVNPRGLIPVGAFTFQIPTGEKVIGAELTGAFGNSQHNSSAIGDLFIDGLLVAHCSDPSPCDNGPGQAVDFVFAEGDLGLLADGLAKLVYDETGCCIIRLAASTLTIITAPGAAPEPATWALMIGGFGLTGAALRRRGGMSASV